MTDERPGVPLRIFGDLGLGGLHFTVLKPSAVRVNRAAVQLQVPGMALEAGLALLSDHVIGVEGFRGDDGEAIPFGGSTRMEILERLFDLDSGEKDAKGDSLSVAVVLTNRLLARDPALFGDAFSRSKARKSNKS